MTQDRLLEYLKRFVSIMLALVIIRIFEEYNLFGYNEFMARIYKAFWHTVIGGIFNLAT